MTACNQQVVTAFEELGLPPEKIAEDLDLDITSVKAVLMQFSALYKECCGAEPKDKSCFKFSEEQHKASIDVIANLAQYSEDERVQARCAMYIRDDCTGRLEKDKQTFGFNFNVLSFNEQMQKALKAINRSKGLIDVESVKAA